MNGQIGTTKENFASSSLRQSSTPSLPVQVIISSSARLSSATMAGVSSIPFSSRAVEVFDRTSTTTSQRQSSSGVHPATAPLSNVPSTVPRSSVPASPSTFASISPDALVTPGRSATTTAYSVPLSQSAAAISSAQPYLTQSFSQGLSNTSVPQTNVSCATSPIPANSFAAIYSQYCPDYDASNFTLNYTYGEATYTLNCGGIALLGNVLDMPSACQYPNSSLTNYLSACEFCNTPGSQCRYKADPPGTFQGCIGARFYPYGALKCDLYGVNGFSGITIYTLASGQPDDSIVARKGYAAPKPPTTITSPGPKLSTSKDFSPQSIPTMPAPAMSSAQRYLPTSVSQSISAASASASLTCEAPPPTENSTTIYAKYCPFYDNRYFGYLDYYSYFLNCQGFTLVGTPLDLPTACSYPQLPLDNCLAACEYCNIEGSRCRHFDDAPGIYQGCKAATWLDNGVYLPSCNIYGTNRSAEIVAYPGPAKLIIARRNLPYVPSTPSLLTSSNSATTKVSTSVVPPSSPVTIPTAPPIWTSRTSTARFTPTVANEDGFFFRSYSASSSPYRTAPTGSPGGDDVSFRGSSAASSTTITSSRGLISSSRGSSVTYSTKTTTTASPIYYPTPTAPLCQGGNIGRPYNHPPSVITANNPGLYNFEILQVGAFAYEIGCYTTYYYSDTVFATDQPRSFGACIESCNVKNSNSYGSCLAANWLDNSTCLLNRMMPQISTADNAYRAVSARLITPSYPFVQDAVYVLPSYKPYALNLCSTPDNTTNVTLYNQSLYSYDVVAPEYYSQEYTTVQYPFPCENLCNRHLVGNSSNVTSAATIEQVYAKIPPDTINNPPISNDDCAKLCTYVWALFGNPYTQNGPCIGWIFDASNATMPCSLYGKFGFPTDEVVASPGIHGGIYINDYMGWQAPRRPAVSGYAKGGLQYVTMTAM